MASRSNDTLRARINRSTWCATSALGLPSLSLSPSPSSTTWFPLLVFSFLLQTLSFSLSFSAHFFLLLLLLICFAFLSFSFSKEPIGNYAEQGETQWANRRGGSRPERERERERERKEGGRGSKRRTACNHGVLLHEYP